MVGAANIYLFTSKGDIGGFNFASDKGVEIVGDIGLDLSFFIAKILGVYGEGFVVFSNIIRLIIIFTTIITFMATIIINLPPMPRSAFGSVITEGLMLSRPSRAERARSHITTTEATIFSTPVNPTTDIIITDALRDGITDL